MYKHEPRWEVEDELLHSTGLPMHQYWHPAPEVLDRLKISASDKLGRRVDAGHKSGYFAAEYGTKEEVPVICFTTPGNYLITTITIA
jgi:sugar (pentulose or hexulose) kinase